MSFLGSHLQILIGPAVPLPAPLPLLEALSKIEIYVADTGRSGFQITLQANRKSTDLLDDPLMLLPQVAVESRVVLTALIGAVPTVLIDGVITNIQNSPGSGEPSTIVLTGEDISVLMDLEEKTAQHPAQPENIIAMAIIAQYGRYGLIPMVIPPPVIDVPVPTERTPQQQATDYAYLQQMADRFGYVFYIKPGPAPLLNSAYWGPPELITTPQRALSVEMGSYTNVTNFTVENDSQNSTQVQGRVQDRRTGQTMPVQSVGVTRAPLAAKPAWLSQSNQRVVQFRESGRDTLQAFARAQAKADQAADRVVTARGELDVARYGGVLHPRSIVGVRGAGYTNDGLYYVKSVTHILHRGIYKQQFELQREGTGSTTPVVVP